MEDKLRIREEISELKKQILIYKNEVQSLDIKVKKLHEEEIEYLRDIPSYKNRSELAKNNYLKLESQSISLKRELEGVIRELNKVRFLVIDEEKSLKESKDRKLYISKEISDSYIELNKKIFDINNRELLVGIREKDCNSRELFNRKIESDLDNREVKLNYLENEFNIKSNELINSIVLHEENKNIHCDNIRSIIEQRKFIEEDKLLVRDKLSKADKLVKDNCELKAQLLLQADKASQAIKTAENKQIMLDKALSELEHQENILKIKDLKIRKMAHEAGLQKELKELEATIK